MRAVKTLRGKLRAEVRRLHPRYWPEMLDDRWQTRARWHLVKLVFRRGLDARVRESIGDAEYYQYACRSCRIEGRNDQLFDLETMARYGKYRGPEGFPRLMEWARSNNAYRKGLNRDAWANRDGRRTIYSSYADDTD